MAPQMDRPARLGEARCEISRGEQAKGGGAVLKRLGGILLNPPCPFGLTVTKNEKPASRGGPGVAFGFLPLDAAVPRDGTMLRGSTLYEGVMADLQEEPTYFARKQGAREVSYTYGFWLVEQVPIGISETGK
ncbi:hypothetical protein LA080_013694 [Diaporthe eres]|nr:hypothetical protein LA080_013694 [Diaporthe eres]